MSFNPLSTYNTQFNTLLQPLDQPYIAGLLRLVLILYGGLAAPHLPEPVLKWFDNVPFRIAFMALIIWTANHDPATAILIALIFFVSINTLSGKKPFEKFGVHDRHE